MKIRYSDVFKVGGLPEATYVAREKRNLEGTIQKYLDEKHALLIVAGPTKTGKTVLIKKTTSTASPHFIAGGTIDSPSAFWDQLAASLNATTEETSQSASANAQTKSQELHATANAVFAQGGAKTTSADTTSSQTSDSKKRTTSTKTACLSTLAQKHPLLIIDDFHYIEPALQLEIVRSLKQLIFDGLPCILGVVPHRAYDAVRIENEMNGRFRILEIEPWSEAELIQIASLGFESMNIILKPDVVQILAANAFKSPHLMQEFCRELCVLRSIKERQEQKLELQSPQSWEDFFRSVAVQKNRADFERLSKGPSTRGKDRVIRPLKAGGETDIYGATLRAIAHTGPILKLTNTDVRTALSEILSSAVPSNAEISRVLKQMSEIAFTQKHAGQPVVDWDEDTLHIADPFFAFFLKWGIQ